MQTITLKGYGTNIPPYEAIELGTYDSYGVEQLQIVPSHGWENLSIIASFFSPSGAEPIKVAVLSGGIIDVPPGATAKQSGKGIIVFAGYKANTQLISTNVAYNIRDHKDIASGDPVCPTPSVVDQIVNAAKSAQENAEKAAGSAKKAEDVAASVRNDADEGKFNGEDGYSPSAGVTQLENGAIISIRDKTGESTATVYNGKDGAKGDKGDTGDKGNTGAKGDKGDKGFSPTATVTQLENGAEIAITDEEGTTKATVKNGSKGDKGDRGSDGVSPTISVEDIENGHRVTIVDATGTTSVDIYNGEDGTDGKDGAQVDDSGIGDKPWSSKHIIDMLCPEIKESGNPVLCYPVAGYPLGVKAKWEPVQEGSGTPYPAGGGKNQLNPAGYEAATKTVNGITFTRLNTGEVVVNGTATGIAIYVLIANFSYPISLSTDRNWSIVGENVISAQGLVSGVTVIRPSDNTLLYIRVQSGETVKTTVQPQIEKGSTPTAWEPYENIRPIKGRDSVAVERCGENLLDIAAFSLDTDKGNRTYKTNVQQLIPPGKYTLKVTQTNPNSGLGMQLFTRDGKKISTTSGNTFNLYGILDSIYFYISNLSGNADSIKDIMLIPSTATAPTTYTPYIGQTNTLTLPETVYEGEVDAVNGEGQETWKMLTLDGTTNKFTQSNSYWRVQFNTAPGVVNNYFTMCSHFPANTFGGNQKGNYIYTRADIMSRYFPDVNALNTYIAAQYAAGTPVQICYKLAEPVSFTATGAQPIPALAGANTVLTDADSTTVTGRADPIKRITDLEDAVASQT
nr:MAG TPA: Pulmonary surfactant-associated protein [Caudoviricetes sp.]